MSTRLSSYERKVIISNWAKGIEDPMYEVVQTKTGRYFVRKRTVDKPVVVAAETVRTEVEKPKDPDIMSNRDILTKLAKFLDKQTNDIEEDTPLETDRAREENKQIVEHTEQLADNIMEAPKPAIVQKRRIRKPLILD